MGDLAPPVSCHLVSSSTGETSSPDSDYKSNAKPIVKSKYGKEADYDENTTNHHSFNQFKCGSYGSSSHFYGPCDTTLTADDDNDINNNERCKFGRDGDEDNSAESDDPFIKVESKKSKAKKASAGSSCTGVRVVTSTTFSSPEMGAQTSVETKHRESGTVSSYSIPNNNVDASSDGGTFAASFKSFSSYNEVSPQKQQQNMVSVASRGSQSPFSYLPSSSYASATSSSKYLPYHGSYASAIVSTSASSSKSLPLGASALTISAWSNLYSSTPSEKGVSSNQPQSNINVEGGVSGKPRGGRPLSSLSSGDGEVNDGTESESGSVSGLSVDGLSRPESVASSSSLHEEQPGKLFVGSLAASVTEQDLYKYFSQFGEVKSCFIKFDLGTNKSRGFGFVVFREAEVINTVMGYCNGFENVNSDIRQHPDASQTRSHVIHGRPIHVRKAKPIAEMKRIRLKDDFDESQQKRVFIGGVPLEVTEEVIQTHFSKVGPVEKVILIFGTSENENGRHRGIGFVTFAHRQHAESAIRIRYHAIPEHFCTIECKPAIQKGDKNLPSEPPIPKSLSSGVNLTLADFQQTANAVSVALPNNAGILPTPEDSSVEQLSTEVATQNRPPPQSWSSTTSAPVDDGNYAHHNNNNLRLLVRADSRPPSALSVDSGFSGARSASPVIDEASSAEASSAEASSAEADVSSKGYDGNTDRGWLTNQRSTAIGDTSSGFHERDAGYSCGRTRGANGLLSRGDETRSSSGEDIWISPSFNKMKITSPNSNRSFQSLRSTYQGWNPNGSANSSLALNPYGINLSLVYPERMDKILADRFGSTSPNSRFKEDGAGSAVKYQWNHWSASKPVGGGVLEEEKPTTFNLEDLSFAPFSRLTFLRDGPVEVIGANGSNGFDVYVR